MVINLLRIFHDASEGHILHLPLSCIVPYFYKQVERSQISVPNSGALWNMCKVSFIVLQLLYFVKELSNIDNISVILTLLATFIWLHISLIMIYKSDGACNCLKTNV